MLGNNFMEMATTSFGSLANAFKKHLISYSG